MVTKCSRLWKRASHIVLDRSETENKSDKILCARCNTLKLRQILRKGVPEKKAIPIGSLLHVIASANKCSLCRLIAHSVRQAWLLDRDDFQNEDLSRVECALYAEPAGYVPPKNKFKALFMSPARRLIVQAEPCPPPIYSAQIAARTDMQPQIRLLGKDASKLRQDPAFHARRVRQSGVEIELVKMWMRICEEEHGSECEEVWWRDMESVLPKGMRVIDVVQMRLVNTPHKCRYVALSYLWGGPGDAYWTTRANLMQRQQDKGVDWTELPGTIADAIHLLQLLGERYLWVDALCIVQDDLDDQISQIKVMDQIYSNALLTVFAAGGMSAQASLPGLRSRRSSFNQHIEKIQGLHLAVSLTTLDEAITRSFWNTRGWTYQEYVLSRRRLWFTPEQVFFTCRRDTWCEDVAAESTSKDAVYATQHIYSLAGPLSFPTGYKPGSSDSYIDRYMRAVQEYTTRHLSYESDILNAFTAIMNIFSKGYETGRGDPGYTFCFGMPVSEIENALLWQPSGSTLLTRRINTRIATPSWSWTGWCGAVLYSVVGFKATYPEASQSLVHAWLLHDDDGMARQLNVRNPIQKEWLSNGREPAVRYNGVQGMLSMSLLDHELPGTLVFCTSSAYLCVEKVNDDPKGAAGKSSQGENVKYISPHYSIFSIRSQHTDSPNIRIGQIILPNSTCASDSLEFIVLSRATDGYDDAFDQSVLGADYYGSLLNVMAVIDIEGGVKERLGVGVIAEVAWLAVNTQEKTVRLR
ncbi:uncharacterized protein FIBRA_09622 [Fibroporia radiculosa]|uniref:Heterokaryon incompatibility domain-containing protein n=1 Tax=Fibroporia radiculosa TaxID=599839 RepID=J4H555_9APHY|nr:uncharacterized protein FIBRA_09622 [Fibroporia radiculosa]CCM06149.1 predicted protein [Fibroporia radiculosa]